MNNNPTKKSGRIYLPASAGDEISLLTNLVKTQQIGVKMLLQNLTEILKDDQSLLVEIVLLITDPNRIAESDVSPEDYATALVAVDRADSKASDVLTSAINHSASKAGFLALPS